MTTTSDSNTPIPRLIQVTIFLGDAQIGHGKDESEDDARDVAIASVAIRYDDLIADWRFHVQEPVESEGG